MKSVDKVVFTDRYKISNRVAFSAGQVKFIQNLPPRFISYDCKLWELSGIGVSAYFYTEVESFANVS
jgi:hypothetical protein